jgi:hypothetical protein
METKRDRKLFFTRASHSVHISSTECYKRRNRGIVGSAASLLRSADKRKTEGYYLNVKHCLCKMAEMNLYKGLQ